MEITFASGTHTQVLSYVSTGRWLKSSSAYCICGDCCEECELSLNGHSGYSWASNYAWAIGCCADGDCSDIHSESNSQLPLNVNLMELDYVTKYEGSESASSLPTSVIIIKAN